MAIKDIKNYIKLAIEGDATIHERLELFKKTKAGFRGEDAFYAGRGQWTFFRTYEKTIKSKLDE